MKSVINHRHVMLKVSEKQINCKGFATLFFDYSIDFKPGQFIMVWIPGVDEKPYTISFHKKRKFGITIEAKGIFSKKAINLEKNDIVGIRGPFGNGFDIAAPFSKIAIIAGGCGIAPLAVLAEQLEGDIFFIHGARSKQFLLYPERFNVQRHFCTDDGSKGYKGFVTDLFEKEIKFREQKRNSVVEKNCKSKATENTDEIVKNEHNMKNTAVPRTEEIKKNGIEAEFTAFDMVYACGPEMMMYRVFQICEAHGILCQVSLERYMRCGFGVCGACVCSDRLVCMDGPVFSSDLLRTMNDFNKTALLKSGKPVGLNQYISWRSK